MTSAPLSYADGGLAAHQLLDLASICAAEMRVAAMTVQLLQEALEEGCLADSKVSALPTDLPSAPECSRVLAYSPIKSQTINFRPLPLSRPP